MIRIMFASMLILVGVTACAPLALQAPPSIAFAPTPFEPTLGPTPGGLATPTPIPPPTNTPAPTPTETEAPASSAPPTDTPTITPTVIPQSVKIGIRDNQISPSQITLRAGQFVRLVIANRGSAELEILVDNLKPDNVFPDESLAGQVPSEQLDQVDEDAGKGTIHLYVMPQGSASVTFTQTQRGTVQFTVKIAGHQLAGTILVQ